MAGEKILIIDDSDALRSLLESILPFAGYQAVSAATGREGLKLVEQAQPDVILTDLELPDMSGLKILEDLNERGISIPTIMMTGYGSEGIAARALQLGVRDYLIKPFTTEEVLVSIERALAEIRLREENALLTAQLNRQNLHLKMICALASAAVSGLAVGPFLQRIVEASRYATGAEGGEVLLLDETATQLRVAASCGQTSRRTGPFAVRTGDEDLQPVLQAEQVVRLHTVSNPSIALQTGESAWAVLQIPLKAHRKPCGLLSVARYKDSTPFDKQDEWILLILATYASLVLERAHPLASASKAAWTWEETLQ
jgi:two-component system NtrC family sensor kinase